MTERENEIVEEAVAQSADYKRRSWLVVLFVIWLIGMLLSGYIAWTAYHDESDRADTAEDETLTLAQQVQLACIDPEVDTTELADICKRARQVIEDTPEVQDPEAQEEEIQESEIQEPEIQDIENQNQERQQQEVQEGEVQEGEVQEPEIQDAENQDPEIDDPENQDPEVDDPDPASPFSFSFMVQGNGGSPDTRYTVTCTNSGTAAVPQYTCEVTTETIPNGGQ